MIYAVKPWKRANSHLRKVSSFNNEFKDTIFRDRGFNSLSRRYSFGFVLVLIVTEEVKYNSQVKNWKSIRILGFSDVKEEIENGL